MIGPETALPRLPDAHAWELLGSVARQNLVESGTKSWRGVSACSGTDLKGQHPEGVNIKF